MNLNGFFFFEEIRENNDVIIILMYRMTNRIKYDKLILNYLINDEKSKR